MKKILIVPLFILLIGGHMDAQQISAIKLDPPQLTKGKLLMQAMSERRSTREFSDKELSLHELSDILWCANGINRKETGMRTVPSALNKQEIDVYAVMKKGAYLYDAKAGELLPVSAGDHRKASGTQPFAQVAPLTLVYVADLNNRMDYTKDEVVKQVYAGISAGHCSQGVYLYAASAGLAAVIHASMDKDELVKALKLRPGQKIMIAQTVGYKK
jgi:SagB-type dehydrogenase family enzyme